jgi:hypothetical protein
MRIVGSKTRRSNKHRRRRTCSRLRSRSSSRSSSCSRSRVRRGGGSWFPSWGTNKAPSTPQDMLDLNTPNGDHQTDQTLLNDDTGNLNTPNGDHQTDSVSNNDDMSNLFKENSDSKGVEGGEELNEENSGVKDSSKSQPSSRFSRWTKKLGDISNTTFKKMGRFYNRRKTRQKLWRTALLHKIQEKIPFLQTKSVEKLKKLAEKYRIIQNKLGETFSDINSNSPDAYEKQLEFATYEFAYIFSLSAYLSILFRLVDAIRTATPANADAQNDELNNENYSFKDEFNKIENINICVLIEHVINCLNSKCEDLRNKIVPNDETKSDDISSHNGGSQKKVGRAMRNAFKIYIDVISNLQKEHPCTNNTEENINKLVKNMNALFNVLEPSDIFSNVMKIPGIVGAGIRQGMSLLMKRKPSETPEASETPENFNEGVL